MKFAVESLSKSSGRLGQFVHTKSGKHFKTPVLMQTTKGGSIPCISREVFDYISKDVQLLQMSLATMQQMAESVTIYKNGLSAYVGYKDYPTILIVRDPCELTPQGSNDKDVVPIYTRRGKESITVNKFMDMIECFQPDIYQGLSDADTNLNSAKKRIQKSVDRTETFMDYCYERQQKSDKLKSSALFAPIVGGFSSYARSQSIKHAKSNGTDNYAGYIMEGFHNYGLTATEVNDEKLLEIMQHCLNEMDVDKPKMLPGAYTPLLILELIRLGVDMFDTSYAYLAATNFKALTFCYDLNGSQLPADLKETPFLDLTDEELKEDFTPFLSNCQCLACRQHTRAYVHHLYKTKELLGPILLMIHNLHHYMQYFECIRECVASDTLSSLIELVKYQTTAEAVDYRIPENTKILSKSNLGKGFMTATISAQTTTSASTTGLPTN